MKLFEDLEEMGGNIRDAVQKIIQDVYGQDLKDDALDEIVNGLSLSDLLELDRAYTSQDAEKIKNVIGPMPQMEYSMGGRQATSQANNRPAPSTGATQDQQPKVGTGTQNTVQTNRNYSGNASKTVANKNVDMNDPNAEEPLEEESDESRLASHREDLKHAKREYRTAQTPAEKAHLKKYIAKVQGRIDNIVNNPLEEESDEEDEPDLDVYSQAEYNDIHAPDEPDEQLTDSKEEEGRDSDSIKVVDMVKWLKRRAGLK